MALHRISRLATAAAIVGGAVAGFVLPAFANHPDLSARVACVGHDQVVTWTIENSETADGTNRTMVIDEISVTEGDVVGVGEGTEFPPRPKDGSSRTATTVLPGGLKGTVTLSLRVHFDDGGLQDVTRSVSVDLPGDCEPKPVPAAEITWDCTSGVVATLSNGGGGTVEFSLGRKGEALRTVRVGANDKTARTLVIGEDETATFEVTAPGMALVTSTITFDCQAPVTTTTTRTSPQILGQVLTQPAPAPAAELPRTGFGLGLALAGSGLVAVGLPLARLRRRSR